MSVGFHLAKLDVIGTDILRVEKLEKAVVVLSINILQ